LPEKTNDYWHFRAGSVTFVRVWLRRFIGLLLVHSVSGFDFFGFNAQNELQYRRRLDSSRMTLVANARRELFEAMKQVSETGHGPVEANPFDGMFNKLESLSEEAVLRRLHHGDVAVPSA
jgi:hypothetical protein